MIRQTTILFGGGVLALPLLGSAAAGPFEDAVSAIQSNDNKVAISILRPLAEQGDARAQVALAVLYATGAGVPRDDAQAVIWYRKAAQQGYIGGQLELGAMYSAGRGVPQDYVLAYMWFNLAASRPNLGAASSEIAVRARNFALEKSDRIAAKMTPAEVAEAQSMAREWKAK